METLPIFVSIMKGEFASDIYIKSYEMALFPSTSLASYVGTGYAEQVLGSFSLKYSISKLCWYTPIDSYKIQALQRNLNSLRIGTGLTVDGVYGTQTQEAMYSYLEYLSSNQIPKLSGQSIAEGIISIADAGKTALELLSNLEKETHGSFNNRTLGLGSVKTGAKASPTGYIQISRSTYNTLRKFEGTSKLVKIAGNYILMADTALETIELIDELGAATKQADDKIASATGAAIGGFVGDMVNITIMPIAIKCTIAAGLSVAGIAGAPAVVITGVGTLVVSSLLDNHVEATFESIGIALAECIDITSLMK